MDDSAWFLLEKLKKHVILISNPDIWLKIKEIHKLPQQQTLIAKETKPDGESMKDTRQGVHIQIDVAAKALFGVLL